MLHITEDDVRRLLPIAECVELMQQVFEDLRAGTAINVPRRRLILPTRVVLHQLAGAWRECFGTKFYSTHPQYGAHFHFMLYESATGRPLALFDANWLGQIRTGAVSGYVARLLAPGARKLALIGAGFQAASQCDAVLAALPRLEETHVWARNPEKAARFAGVTIAPTADAAVRDADIVVTATSARDPVIEASWVKRGALVIAMGSNNPQRRELPADLVNGAAAIIVDSVEQSKIEAGDLLLAGVDWERVIELQNARPPYGGTVIFKSNGLGVEDVAAAAHVWQRITLERAPEDPSLSTR